MSRKLQTIYEYFNDYSEILINEVIANLSEEEQEVIRARYGKYLHEPCSTEEWNTKMSKQFYGRIIPKMNRLLKKAEEVEEPFKPIIEETKEEVEIINIEEPKEEIERSEEVKLPKIESSGIEIYSSLDLEIIQMIREGKSNNEICSILNIEPRELWKELRELSNKGFTFYKTYSSTGDTMCQLFDSLSAMKFYKTSQNRTLFTRLNENEIKLLVISDLHFGSALERVDLVNLAYDYCKKNGINIILCGGDFVDGINEKGEQIISDPYKQIEHLIKDYPYDKDILTFGVGGNHDLKLLISSDIDIRKILENYRQDIIVPGYNNSAIKIKNDKIHLYHSIKNAALRKTDPFNTPIILKGHYHEYSTKIQENQLIVNIPSICEINQPIPSLLEMNLYFQEGKVSTSIIKHICFMNNRPVILGETRHDIPRLTEPNSETEENDSTKTLVKRPSRIDSFNARWNK